MHDETEIANRLKQNIPQVVERTVPTAPILDTTNGQATIAPDYPLDEMTQYKLHDYFGEEYREGDEVKRQQAQYIFEEIAKRIETSEYGFVISKVREIERLIGTSYDGNRLYKMYQWLKLDKVRRNIDAEMGAL